MPDPLTIAAIGAGSSLLSGFIGSRVGQQDIPDELNQQISDLQNPNFFLPQIQRAFGPEEETNFNINQQLAQRGIDSPMIAEEQRQAATARRGEQVTQALGSMEGQRMDMLNRALQQRSQIEGRNTQTRASAFNQAASGAVGSVVQGLGQMNANQILGEIGQNAPGGSGGGAGGGSGGPGLSGTPANNILPLNDFNLGPLGRGASPFGMRGIGSQFGSQGGGQGIDPAFFSALGGNNDGVNFDFISALMQ